MRERKKSKGRSRVREGWGSGGKKNMEGQREGRREGSIE